ncbi:MAG: fused MFS/spermidine synthase [Patescibacteria group bacterium]
MDKISNRFLLIITFISGFSIMAMEISASRLLAPYFGTSLFVWTNIIGIVMAALACGYYLGGFSLRINGRR